MITENGLIDRGFATSNIDRFLFYKDILIVILHSDIACMFGASQEKIDAFVESLKRADPKLKEIYVCQDGGFDFAVENPLKDFLSQKFTKKAYNND